jgi:hypothetical protein
MVLACISLPIIFVLSIVIVIALPYGIIYILLFFILTIIFHNSLSIVFMFSTILSYFITLLLRKLLIQKNEYIHGFDSTLKDDLEYHVVSMLVDVPIKTIIFSLYLLVFLIGVLVENNYILIESPFISGFLTGNMYSAFILISIDRIYATYHKEKREFDIEFYDLWTDEGRKRWDKRCETKNINGESDILD